MEPSWDLVLKDIKDRDDFGRKKYGIPLSADNPKDMLWEAYCEALDLVVYLRTEIEKRKLKTP